LRAEFRAGGFNEYLQAGDNSPKTCSAQSSLRRGCAIRLSLDQNATLGVAVEVQCLTDCLMLLDSAGQTIQLEELCLDIMGTSMDTAQTEDSWWWIFPSWSTQRPEEPQSPQNARRESTSSFQSGRSDSGIKEEVVEEATVPPTEESHAAWEGRTLTLTPLSCADDVISAWYGHPYNPEKRLKITEQIRKKVEEAQGCAPEGDPPQIEIFASNSEFGGDPAWLVWKCLTVTIRTSAARASVDEGIQEEARDSQLPLDSDYRSVYQSDKEHSVAAVNASDTISAQ